jgi:mono/diheme cytochrome c family protein
MLKKSLFILTTAIFAAGALFASDANSNATINPGRTQPTDGKGMYTNYCAPCHGANGRGQGPIAISKKLTPPDIATLSQRNGGVYPKLHVVGVLEHGTWPNGHAQSVMPEWGSTIGMISQNDKANAKLRIHNLSKYLETLQVK